MDELRRTSLNIMSQIGSVQASIKLRKYKVLILLLYLALFLD